MWFQNAGKPLTSSTDKRNTVYNTMTQNLHVITSFSLRNNFFGYPVVNSSLLRVYTEDNRCQIECAEIDQNIMNKNSLKSSLERLGAQKAFITPSRKTYRVTVAQW